MPRYRYRANEHCPAGEVRAAEFDFDLEGAGDAEVEVLPVFEGTSFPGLASMFYSLLRAIPRLPANLPIDGKPSCKNKEWLKHAQWRWRRTLGLWASDF